MDNLERSYFRLPTPQGHQWLKQNQNLCRSKGLLTVFRPEISAKNSQIQDRRQKEQC